MNHLDAARAWCAVDPDPETRKALQASIDAKDMGALDAGFGNPLAFGTAGIRGPLGPGPGGMNQVLVRRVTMGLASYLSDQGQRAGVVIGYDGRYKSRVFAEDAASVLRQAGFSVWLYDEPVPTPVLGHAVLALEASAGIMVTASHNPAADNGYKVYWGNGAQIIPPDDEGIAACIEQTPLTRVPEVPAFDATDVDAVPESVGQTYLDKVLALRVHPSHAIRAVYTAMHGVGFQTLAQVLDAAGHHDLHAVGAQRDPDPDFPTAPFPNPEEAGALDLARALAEDVGAEIIIAHDPDADRLAVAVPNDDGQWHKLSGNEVGLLLADDLLRHGKQGPNRMVANTIVSTGLLRVLAAQYDAVVAETLTGFKWIANTAIGHDGPFVVGFEEALGYSAGDVVRDKDGISAALLLLDLAGWCKAQGSDLCAHLEGLYRRIGYAESAQHSITMQGIEGKQQIEGIMEGLRTKPPAEIAGAKVAVVRDILTSTATEVETGAQTPIDLPSSNVLAFDFKNGDRILVRPSGTEPKIKFYFECHQGLTDATTLHDARRVAQGRVHALRDDLLRIVGQ